MPRKRLSMRKIRDVLRLKYGLGRSHREIAAILRISHSTVGSYVQRAREAGVSWPVPDELDDASLGGGALSADAAIGGAAAGAGLDAGARKLARHKGVTLQLLWLEYREAHPGGISTAASATATGSGAGASTWCCARSTGPARRRAWTTRARRSR